MTYKAKYLQYKLKYILAKIFYGGSRTKQFQTIDMRKVQPEIKGIEELLNQEFPDGWESNDAAAAAADAAAADAAAADADAAAADADAAAAAADADADDCYLKDDNDLLNILQNKTEESNTCKFGCSVQGGHTIKYGVYNDTLVEIIKTHNDDDKAYYTIRLDGNEKQVDSLFELN